MKKLEFMVNGNELWCGNCVYFHQHYTISDEYGLCACNCGHCSFPQNKHRNAFQDACARFVNRNKGEHQ